MPHNFKMLFHCLSGTTVVCKKKNIGIFLDCHLVIVEGVAVDKYHAIRVFVTFTFMWLEHNTARHYAFSVMCFAPSMYMCMCSCSYNFTKICVITKLKCLQSILIERYVAWVWKGCCTGQICRMSTWLVVPAHVHRPASSRCLQPTWLAPQASRTWLGAMLWAACIWTSCNHC